MVYNLIYIDRIVVPRKCKKVKENVWRMRETRERKLQKILFELISVAIIDW